MAERRSKKSRRGEPKKDQPITGATGASDATSGGGAGAGIPDADTQMRTGGAASGGDVESDRRKLFPELYERKGKKEDKGKKNSPPTHGG